MTTKPTGRVIAQRLLQLEHGASSEDLLERILDPGNLQAAWLRVKANGGAAGVDGMTIAQFPAFARQHWEKIRSRLLAGTYHPAPVRRLFIPKPNGDLRPLGIRSHRGYWFMAGTSIVQRALDNRWLTERGVPNLTQQWVEMHYGKRNEQFNPAAVNLTGIPTRREPACQVVWEPGGQPSRRPD